MRHLKFKKKQKKDPLCLNSKNSFSYQSAKLVLHYTAGVLEVSEEESSIVHRFCIVGNIGGLINPQRFHFSFRSFKKPESFLYRTTQVSLFLE